MKSIVLAGVFAGYEVMAIANRNRWHIIRCQPIATGMRVMYRESCP